MPPPGAPAQELLIARFRRHARHLFWSALVLVATSGAVAYLWGNLPAPFENWMLLSAGGVLVLVLAVLPYLFWASHRYTITTRRVIARDGISSRNSREMSHARGYAISVRRGPIQRIWGAATITLTNGVDSPLVLANVPSAALIHETLADQIEVGQILAHRDAQSGTDSAGY